MNIFKSILAVISGIILIVVLSVGTDFLLEKTGVFPQGELIMNYTWMLLAAFIYRSIYAVAGGYLTATLSPNRPVLHALVLGGIGTLTSIPGIFLVINMNRTLWYPIALVITSLPLCWLGGKLKTNKLKA